MRVNRQPADAERYGLPHLIGGEGSVEGTSSSYESDVRASYGEAVDEDADAEDVAAEDADAEDVAAEEISSARADARAARDGDSAG